MKTWYIKSDNFTGYMTERAYKEFRLQMSTGDFHMHTAIRAIRVNGEVFDFDTDAYNPEIDSDGFYPITQNKGV